LLDICSIGFIDMNSGITLKMLRLFKGFTQREMANKLEISQQAYSKIERQPWVENKMLDKISLLLNFSKQDLDEIRKIVLQKGSHENEVLLRREK